MRFFKAGLLLGVLAMLLAPRPGVAADPQLFPYPGMGPPTTSVTINGSYFGLRELVDVYFDETAVKVAATSSSGAFATLITIPKAATPGLHFITAVGRKSSLAAFIEFTVGTDWAQFHFDSWHRGYNPYENVLNPTTVAGLEQLYAFSTGGAIDASAAISHDSQGYRTFFIPSRDGKLYVGEAEPTRTGVRVDKVLSAGATIAGSPAVYDRRLFLCSADGKVWWYEKNLGALQALNNTHSAVYAAPTVTYSGVFVAAVNGKVYKFSRTTANKSLWAAPAATGGAINASPTVANRLVYVASGDGKLYAFNNTTGAVVWNVPLCVGVPGLASTPAVSNGLVYVGTPNNKLCARDAVDGAEVWTFLAGGPIFSSPAVANGRVYFGANDGYLYCLDAAYGVQLWKAYTGGKVYSSPTVANGVVYVGSDSRRVFAFNAANGARLWSAWTNGMIRSSPVVTDGLLFVTSMVKQFYIYAPDALGPESPARRGSKRQPPDPRSLVPDPNLKLE